MPGQTGQALYRKAKARMPGGTQLLSKRPEMFLPETVADLFQVGPRAPRSSISTATTIST